MRRIAAIVLVLVACSDSETPAETPTPTTEQMASMQRSSAALTSTTTSLQLADALFNFDPDLDPSGTPADNAKTIKSNLDGAACAKVSLTGATGLTVDFGSGCAFNGVTVSGALTVSVTGPDSGAAALTVDLTLTSLVVNGWDLDGTASFSVSGNGSTLTTKLDLTHAGSNTKFDGAVTGSPNSMTIDGALTLSGSGATLSASLTSVVLEKSACWPSGGTTDITGLGSLTFDATTATTGQAHLVIQTPIGPTPPMCYALPSHGASCNATPCPTKG